MGRAVIQESHVAIHFLPGNVARPGVCFFDPNGGRIDTGFYLEEDGSLSVAIDGAKVFSFTGSGTSETFADGTVGAPGMAFTAEPASGLYRIGAADVGMSVNGVLTMEWKNTAGAVQTLLPSGTAAVPALAWSAASTTGFSFTSSKTTLSVAGVATISLGANVTLGSAGMFAWSSTTDPNVAADTMLFRDAANTVAQYNGVNAQTLNVYNTRTDASNYERGIVKWSSNTFLIGTEKLGTGSTRTLGFTVGGAQITSLSASIFSPISDQTLALGDSTHSFTDAFLRRRITKIATITYSASMTPDASLGDAQTITITNGTAFTINAPTNPLTGQYLEFLLRNTSGGAAGVATWNAVFKMTAWTQAATGFSRVILFRYDGTNWVEVDRGAADVPN